MSQEVYDPATKVWTSIFAVILAGIVDWFAVIMPTWDHPPRDAFMQWWWLSVLLGVLFPVLWIAGHLRRRNYEGVVMWIACTSFVLCMQVVLLKWSVGQ